MDYVRTYGGGSQVMGERDLKEGMRPDKGHKWMENSSNKELQDQYRSAVIVTSIEVRGLEWAGHVRMDDERMVKRVFLGNPGERRKPGRSRIRWLDCVEDDLKILGVRRWRITAEDREEWAIILKEAMVKL
jgi:hypothetical protein